MSTSILKKTLGKKNKSTEFKYPGKPVATDGNTAAIMCERESTDAAGAYPITPSTQMGEYWADAAAKGHLNISEVSDITGFKTTSHFSSSFKKAFGKTPSKL